MGRHRKPLPHKKRGRPKQPLHTRFVAENTFAAVARAFIASDKFRDLAPSTQQNWQRELYLAEGPEMLGALRTDEIRPSLVQAFLDGYSSRPGKQQTALTVLRQLEKWAIVRDLLPRAITTGVEILKSDDGHVPWTDEQITLALAHTKPHLARAIQLAANTGQRGSDLTRMRWSDFEIKHGRLGINIEKTKKVGLKLWVPVPPDFAREIEIWDRQAPLILVKANGQPWTREQLTMAWQWERRNNPALAPIRQMVLHGLRAYAIVRLLRAGATTGLIAQCIGMSEAMVARYCRHSAQAVNAAAAMAFLDGTSAERNFEKGKIVPFSSR